MKSDKGSLPDGWAKASIGDVTVNKIPQVVPDKKLDFIYIDISSIDNNIKEIISPKKLHGEQAPSRARQLITVNDVLVSMTRPNLNAVALVPDLHSKAIASTGFDVLRSIEVEPKWLFLNVRSEEFVREMSTLVQGALYPAVKSKDVRDYRISVPPLNEQKRIVAKIEELQSLSRRAREALETVPELLEQLRQSILATAFRGDMTRQWREQNPVAEPASELLKRIRIERRKRWEATELDKLKAKGLTGDKLNAQFAKRRKRYKEPEPVDTTDLPELPEGWCWANIDELSVVVRGASPRPAGDPRFFGGRIPWITVSQLTTNGAPFLYGVEASLTEEGMAKSRFVEKDTLLLTNSGATLGVPKITKIGGCINDGIAAMLFIDYPIKLYLYYYFQTLTNKLRKINQGAAQPNLNTEIIRNIAIPLPPVFELNEVLKKIETKLQRCEKTISLQLNLAKDLEYLEQSILSKAFSGELVPQDPNDEPASILLERIRQEKARLASEQKTKLRQRGKKMKGPKIKQKDILTILQESASAMTPEELFAAGGFGEDSVNAFYEQLRAAVIAKKVRETRKGADVRLEAML